MSDKDWMERIAELVIEDKELHDAIVRLINAMAAEKEEKAAGRLKKHAHYEPGRLERLQRKREKNREDVSIQ